MTGHPASPNRADDGLPLDIRALMPGDLPATIAILTQGMRDNPLHVTVFGADPMDRRHRLARFLDPLVRYVHANGMMLGAFAQGELIGVLGMIRPGRCRPGAMERLRFARALLPGVPPASLLRIHRWLSAWASNDPPAPHWHIGPLAVLPDYRRRGIGRRLMLRCCQHVDSFAAMAWLETDLEINAGFYRTLGFELVSKKPVLGVPT
ncbi:MAG: GNAT family N-acetyltransferase [Rhodobacteraceae bacterium]|nr:MAG: GNAT family N-acetyltransferase [Paracoccaceae bacterium]